MVILSESTSSKCCTQPAPQAPAASFPLFLRIKRTLRVCLAASFVLKNPVIAHICSEYPVYIYTCMCGWLRIQYSYIILSDDWGFWHTHKVHILLYTKCKVIK